MGEKFADMRLEFCISFGQYGNYIIYRIAQNFGKVKLWRIGRFRILARKTLANTQIYHGNFGEIQ